jgi:hypothetical protein
MKQQDGQLDFVGVLQWRAFAHVWTISDELAHQVKIRPMKVLSFGCAKSNARQPRRKVACSIVARVPCPIWSVVLQLVVAKRSYLAVGLAANIALNSLCIRPLPAASPTCPCCHARSA